MPAVVSRPLAAPLPTLRATEEEAPATPPPPPVAEEEELKIPDYSKWLYPALLSTAAAPKPEMKFPLAETKTPHMLPPAILLQWCEADVLASLPLTLPPEYVIFGGARYSGAPLDLLRPPFVPQVSFEKTSAYYESAEAQRLQFLLDQLDVAKNYLKIEVKRMAEVRHVASTPPPPVDPVPSASRSGEDVLLKHGEEEDLSKATVWTTAYFGSPQQLNRVLTSKNADGVLSSAGYVQYHRRQWGLKRTGDTFVLGLGMKATALQFAAAAGKLDNVVLLLTKGAKDNASPPLKEILLKESMVMITAICAPRVRPPRVRRPVATEETYMQDTHAGTTSTFVKEQVVSIDDAAYPHAGAVSYHATAFS
ncbi:calphotin-like protein [Leptomonas pyrrhocoris]|uniref:Calphotin-like protein n=1 Tax=Leptomonas pyrrhocoris TaxID=157538 RepID=A0A0M9G4E1_LEPPY|nr:calphotin-like protein [Leptomonas pyrrhocoris]KPA81899.1 calphotin-like protein [Leptomonas pyrrhocoris]|eukprot:XP_015660338.1 calphotin-like protein [Leptomonas pyrrhocoris]